MHRRSTPGEVTGTVDGNSGWDREGRRGSARLEVLFDVAASRLWLALTDPGELAEWIGVVTGELRIHGEINVAFRGDWEMACLIDRCDPGSCLIVSIDPGPAGTQIVVSLSPEGQQTRLVFEEREVQWEQIVGAAAEWHVYLENLRSFLAGQTSGFDDTRFAELVPIYRTLAEEADARWARTEPPAD